MRFFSNDVYQIQAINSWSRWYYRVFYWCFRMHQYTTFIVSRSISLQVHNIYRSLSFLRRSFLATICLTILLPVWNINAGVTYRTWTSSRINCGNRHFRNGQLLMGALNDKRFPRPFTISIDHFRFASTSPIFLFV